MGIKRILLPLPGSSDHARETEMALATAKLLGAHVEALYISAPPPSPRGSAYVTNARYGGRAATLASVDLYAEERERQTRQAREQFAAACAEADIAFLSAPDESERPFAASWREQEGSYAEVASHRAIAFDLMVAASAAVMDSLKEIAEQSLLRVHRPVLLAPLQPGSDLTRTAMIAWDESPECWHAVSAAVPFLQMASDVQVVSVDRKPETRRASQAEVLAYLRAHGIAATAQVVAPDLRSVGDTLLAKASEENVGLMVMGAYSHSRLREMLIGGATQHVLKHASAKPVLLAH